MRSKLTLVPALLALLAAAPAATAAPTRASLPTVTRTLSASKAQRTACVAITGRERRSVGTSTYRAPISGFVTGRLAASDRSDWDLTVVDAASDRVIATSNGFGSHEVVQTWVDAGQRLKFMGCRRAGKARRAKLSIELVDVARPADQKASLVRVALTDARQAQRLEDIGLDVTHEVTAHYADVIVAADQFGLLRKTGLAYKVRIADLSQEENAWRVAGRKAAVRTASAEGNGTVTGRSSYRTLTDVQTELKAIADGDPSLVRPTVIGHSFQGRELGGVEIADDVQGHDGRPVYLVVAMHHAREWPSVEAAMEYAHMLASRGAGESPEIQAKIATQLHDVRTVIIPLINPDGFVSSRGFDGMDPADELRDNGVWSTTGADKAPVIGDPVTHEPNLDACAIGCAPPSTVESIAPPGGILTYRRKNCDGESSDPGTPCELQWGVDPNRNYGELWGGNGGDANPDSQAYHGPGPWSEPETQAVHAYSQTHQVTALITLHNVAALVLRPPGLHFNGKAPDETALKDLGDRMAAATGYTSEYGFQLYDTAGTTEDWNYAAAGTYGYTIEIGPEGGSFHLPYQEGFVDQWTGKYADDRAHTPVGTHGGLREALLDAGAVAASPADHAILNGTAPAGAVLRVHRDFVTKTSEYCKFALAYPLINPAFVGGLGGPEEVCTDGRQPPMSIPDKLDTTTVVPADGTFSWHVGPSTRPFVGWKAEEVPSSNQQTYTPHKTTTSWANEQPAQSLTAGLLPDDNGVADPPEDTYEDVPLDIGDVPSVTITVTAGSKDDYDMRVYRKNADGSLAEVDSSASGAGKPETVTLSDPTPGQYVARVINYDGGDGSHWTMTVSTDSGPTVNRVSTGQTEPYTLTCEIDGQVVKSQDIVVDRGDVVDGMDPCGTAAA
jgi:hypothetical protein